LRADFCFCSPSNAHWKNALEEILGSGKTAATVVRIKCVVSGEPKENWEQISIKKFEVEGG